MDRTPLPSVTFTWNNFTFLCRSYGGLPLLLVVFLTPLRSIFCTAQFGPFCTFYKDRIFGKRVHHLHSYTEGVDFGKYIALWWSPLLERRGFQGTRSCCNLIFHWNGSMCVSVHFHVLGSTKLFWNGNLLFRSLKRTCERNHQTHLEFRR